MEAQRDDDIEVDGIFNNLVVESELSKWPFQSPQFYPDRPAFEVTAHQQCCQSGLFRLPLELRRAIYLELWRSAGTTQHIFLRDDHYTCAPCISQHDAPDERQAELESLWSHKAEESHLCAPSWARRLHSVWCNHWRCEENVMRAQKRQRSEYLNDNNAEGNTTAAVPRSPFLPMLLTCKQMYLECRTSLYASLTFTFTRYDIAHDFFATRQSPIIHDIRRLNLACRLVLRDPDSYPQWGLLDRWDALLRTLPTLASLTSVDCWLDALDLKDRIRFSTNPRLFLAVNADLARMLTVDLPLPEERKTAWVDWPKDVEVFRLRPRAYPRFWTDPDPTWHRRGAIRRVERAGDESSGA